MPSYTIELIHPDRRGRRYYIGEDMHIYRNARRCKPMDLETATQALASFLATAVMFGTAFDAHIVELADPGETE